MSVCCIIPARYKSKRLPGKPLLKIGKKEILLLTYEKITKNFSEKDIYVFTDSKTVKKKLESKIKNLLYFKKKFQNGTERASYGLRLIRKKYSGVLIVSCDNPYVDNFGIKATLNCYKKIRRNNQYCAATIHCKTHKKKLDKNIAKLVLSKTNDILYISRNEIPSKSLNNFYFTHHGPVCIKFNHLKNYHNIQSTPLQILEDNEWLNFIERGFKIKSALVKKINREINTKKDLKYYRNR